MSKAPIHEVERAFLPSRIPEEISGVRLINVLDVYLSSETDLLSKLRLRQQGERFGFTKKVVTDPDDLSVQQEYNVPLDQKEFELFRKLGGRVLSKDRYEVKINESPAEVDVFNGLLRGLVIIEFEFPNEAERDAFTPPDMCIVDVTQENFIAGAYLAGKSYGDIAPELERFGYTPLFG